MIYIDYISYRQNKNFFEGTNVIVWHCHLVKSQGQFTHTRHVINLNISKYNNRTNSWGTGYRAVENKAYQFTFSTGDSRPLLSFVIVFKTALFCVLPQGCVSSKKICNNRLNNHETALYKVHTWKQCKIGFIWNAGIIMRVVDAYPYSRFWVQTDINSESVQAS